jgi:hypothetical protein
MRMRQRLVEVGSEVVVLLLIAALCLWAAAMESG